MPGKCRKTCATRANVMANAARPAQPAQTPRQMPQDLRSPRKRPGKCRETCAARANAPENAARPAQSAQTPRQMPPDLRNPRKRPGKRRETCAACAGGPGTFSFSFLVPSSYAQSRTRIYGLGAVLRAAWQRATHVPRRTDQPPPPLL